MSTTDSIIIIAGGEIENKNFLLQKLGENNAVIICADSGANHLHGLEIIPQYTIGDMDSISPEILDAFTNRGTQIIKHPTHKENTDTALAIELALSFSPKLIEVYGALGKRFDHAFANVSLLGIDLPRGTMLKLVNEDSEVFVVRDEALIEGKAGQIVSIFPFGTSAAGITIKGFAYELEDGCMEMNNPHGVSNVLLADTGLLRVRSGALLVIRYFAIELP